MARENLPQGQIVPAARPLGSFLQPRAADVPRPAAAPRVPEPRGVDVIQQGGRGDVQGFNQFAQLQEALGPFTDRLIKVAAGGVQLYADRQYEIGDNEMLKAHMLANQQAQNTAAQYSADGRKIAQKDPVAALLMDKVNPFRRWGRENRQTALAGEELMPALMERYRNTPGIAALTPGHPTLKTMQASVVMEIAQKYGITENSRGFVENFLPKVGKAQEKLYDRHQDDYVKNAKDYAWKESAARVAAMYREATEAAERGGLLEWTEFGPDGKPVTMSASRSENRKEWLRGMSILITRVADRLAAETGIPGETSWLQGKMFEQLALIAGDIKATDLAEAIYGAEYGPRRIDGSRPTVLDTMGPQVSKAEFEQRDLQFRRDELANKQGLQWFEDDLMARIAGVPDGPAKDKIIDSLVQKWGEKGVRRSDMFQSVESLAKTAKSVDLLAFDVRPVQDFLIEIEQLYGSAFNQKANFLRLKEMTRNFPADLRDDFFKQFGSIASKKQNEKASYSPGLIEPLIKNKIRASTERFYPSDVREAALRGGDPVEFLKYGKANASESIRRQEAAYRAHVYQALDAATVKKGSQLTSAEVSQVVSQSLEQYGAKDKEAKAYLFPGVAEFGTPGVEQSGPKPPAAAPGGTAKPNEPAKPRPPAYNSSQLDRVPDREKRLRDPNNPVMQGPSVSEEIKRVLNGRAPSNSVIRAARDAGMSVGKFLLKQSEFYDWLPLKPEDRNKLLRSSAQAEGTANNIANQVLNTGSALANYAFRVIAPPAMAAPPPQAQTYVATTAGGRSPNSLLELIRTGEGGWDSVNRGRAGDSKPIPGLSRMTIAQVMDLQRKGIFAVGAFQFIPKTLKIALQDSGLSPNDQFNPTNQARLATALMVGTKRPALRDYLTGRSNDVDAAHRDLANEWASLQGPSGRGAYDGDSAGNYAGIPAAKVRRALIEARRFIMEGR